jgi:hypothetical protein
MRSRGRFLAGVVLLAAGLLLGFADLFLLLWSLKSGRAIGGARGGGRMPWLPPMVLPQIALATALVATVAASLASRREPLPLALRLGAPPAATVVLFAALYLDPAARLWRATRPLRRAAGLPGALALDAALVLAALVVLSWPVRAGAPPRRARAGTA